MQHSTWIRTTTTVLVVGLIILSTGFFVACNGKKKTPGVEDTAYWRSKLAAGDAIAIGKLKKKGDQALPLLIEFIGDPDPTVSATAVSLTGRLSKEARVQAVPALLQAMRRSATRQRAELTLRDLGSSVVPQLITVLEAGDPELTKFAVAVLAGGMAEDAAPALPHLLRILDSGADEKTKINAIGAIAAMGMEGMSAMGKMQEIVAAGGPLAVYAGRAYKRLEVADKPGAYTPGRQK